MRRSQFLPVVFRDCNRRQCNSFRHYYKRESNTFFFNYIYLFYFIPRVRLLFSLFPFFFSLYISSHLYLLYEANQPIFGWYYITYFVPDLVQLIQSSFELSIRECPFCFRYTDSRAIFVRLRIYNDSFRGRYKVCSVRRSFFFVIIANKITVLSRRRLHTEAGGNGQRENGKLKLLRENSRGDKGIPGDRG